MGVHTAQKKTTSRIYCFLYHTRMDTTIDHQLDASTAFLQLELGIIDTFSKHHITSTVPSQQTP
jgi:hypothetical protein